MRSPVMVGTLGIRPSRHRRRGAPRSYPRPIDLTDLETFAQGPPHEHYRHLRDHAPVHWHEPTEHTPDGEGFWSLTRHADVSTAASDATTFSSCTGGERDGGGTLLEDLPLGFAAGVLFNMQDDPRHHHVRRLVTPALSPRRLRQVEEALSRRCDRILDDAVEGGTFDALVDVAAELPLQAIAELLGVPQEDRHRLLAWADATLDYDDRDLGQVSERSQQAAAEMFEYGTNLLEAKRSCPMDDLLTTIATAELPAAAGEPGPLSDLEQQMFFNLLIAAGSETTRNSLAAGLLALIDHPDQWDALAADRALLAPATEEILRWASSTIYNRRTATTDIVVQGQQIAAGDKVVLWWQAANFDERAFDGPDRFDTTRRANPHLAFGLGSHFCLGANLARLEIRLVLDGLLDRVARLEPAGEPVRTRSNKHMGFRSVPVHAVPR